VVSLVWGGLVGWLVVVVIVCLSVCLSVFTVLFALVFLFPPGVLGTPGERGSSAEPLEEVFPSALATYFIGAGRVGELGAGADVAVGKDHKEKGLRVMGHWGVVCFSVMQGSRGVGGVEGDGEQGAAFFVMGVSTTRMSWDFETVSTTDERLGVGCGWDCRVEGFVRCV
jgi:hypothetical protein